MDPITAVGLAASIIAVIQLAGALIQPATSSLGPSENDEKELRRLLTTMTGFQTAYNNLEQYVKSNPDLAETLATALKQPIEDCKAILAELKLRLVSMTFVRKHIIGRKWDKTFKRLVKRLDDARELFDVILQGDQSERLIKISQFVTQRSEDIGTIKEGVKNAAERLSEIHLTAQINQLRIETQAAQRKLKDEILQWLTTADPRSNHQRACASHKTGTGDWFTKGQDYQKWLTEPKAFFWLNGKAGCGKTVLSATIIDQTIAFCDENQGCVIAYFYFSFTDSAKQQCANMLSSLIEQLTSQADIIPGHLASLHRTHKRNKPPVDSLNVCLQSLVNEMLFLHVYLVIDAIDEIPDTDEREETCKLLEELSQNPKAHVLITSRREHDITRYMSQCSDVTDISIQNPEVDHDILLYIREELKKDKRLNRWSALHSEIEDVLSRKADGMFRWAACQLDALKKCPSVKKVRDALKHLPKTLDDTYERILLSLLSTHEESRDIIVEALRWLCFSTEVLTIEQLAKAAVFSATVEAPSEETTLGVSFDKDEFFQDPLDILTLLSGLVVCLIPEDGGNSGDSDDLNVIDDIDDAGSQPEIDEAQAKVLLSHFSVKEYLVSGRLGSKVDRFAMVEHQSHEILATKCLYFLLYSFLEDYEDYKDYEPSLRKDLYERSFSKYAEEEWATHAKKVDHESRLSDMIISVLEAEQNLKEKFLDGIDSDDRYDGELTPLYLAASIGLYWPCKKLIQDGADVNLPRGQFGSVLQAASADDHESIVQLLLDHGADVNIEGGKNGSVLQAASTFGDESIVQLLLNHGADFNIEGGKNGSALQAVEVLSKLPQL